MRENTRRLRNFILSISKPELFTILVLAAFGTAMVFTIPFGAGNDEETHLARVWEMSAFQFLPNEGLRNGMRIPTVYRDLSYRRLPLIKAGPFDLLTEYAGLKLDAHGYVNRAIETRSVYSPPLLAPQALVMRYLGRYLDIPALIVFYACRLTGLFIYTLLAWLAVRWIPFGKWVLALVAVAPMAIFQASTISADAISNGISLVFIAGTLAVAMQERVDLKKWLWLATLFLILFWGKIYVVPLALLPFLIIPPSKFTNRKQYVGLIIVALVFFLIEVTGWNALAYSHYNTGQYGAQPAGQVTYILTHPFDFAVVITRNLLQNFPGHLRGWIALYGYNYWPVPGLVYVFFPLAILVAIFHRVHGEEPPGRLVWIGLMVTFVVSYIATVTSVYISFSPVGNPTIVGMQGRYFFATLPLLLLALITFFRRNMSNWNAIPAKLRTFRVRFTLSSNWMIVPSLIGLGIYFGGLVLVYHVTCGAQFYRFDYCYGPNYKNFAPTTRYSEPISSSLTLTQEIIPDCDGMFQIRFWVNAVNADEPGSTHLTLSDRLYHADLANADVPNTKFPASGWYTLQFNPDWQSAQKLYTLTITGPSSNSGPRISYGQKSEYTDGSLFDNDRKIPEDILFQWGCVAGLSRLVR